MLGFAAIILLGTLLLMLPFASQSGVVTPFSDALFTATSAVCVTGLVVQDTATYWSPFGQAVILLLIQIGGMGIVTLSVAIWAASGRTISLKQRSTMQEALSGHQVGNIIQLGSFILKLTFLIEFLGAVLLAPVFCREFGIGKGIWYGIFHSISAFCNAGFDLMGVRSPYSSLTSFSRNWLVNVTIMVLIIVGGIGFLTWEDIRKHGLHLRRYRMQSKVILTVSLLLVLLPALYFFFFEFTEGSFSLRIQSALFQSVTTRTAGFNTADLTRISESGLALMMFLMIVGGSPGSTAGGLKTTTLAVLLSTAVSVFRRRKDINFFRRRIEGETIRNASTLLVMYLTLFLAGGCIISSLEGLPLLPCLYETASAVATVGLSLGLTPTLGEISRLILILLMYIGRVGGLTLLMAPPSQLRANAGRMPQEKMNVG